MTATNTDERTLPDFVTALEMELQLRGVAFDRADVLHVDAGGGPRRVLAHARLLSLRYP